MPQDRLAFGKQAEQIACRYLESKGLKFVCKNFRCKCGEIDLIMQSNDAIIFVEVKARKQHAWIPAHTAIDSRKRHKIINTAQIYLQKARLYDKILSRFDVVTVEYEPRTETYQIDWLPNAFIDE